MLHAIAGMRIPQWPRLTGARARSMSDIPACTHDRGLVLRLEHWPLHAGAKALQATLRGGAAELAPSASVRLTPADSPCSGGLSVGASCRLGPNGGSPALDAEWSSGNEEVSTLILDRQRLTASCCKTSA